MHRIAVLFLNKLLSGFGRSSNPEYILFLEILRKCLEDPDNTSNKVLS